MEGKKRVVIENVSPEIDGGIFAIKRVVGEKVVVQADIFADGHDELSAELLYRTEDEKKWHRTPMRFMVNDRWQACFNIEQMKTYYYTIEAWVDHFKTWRKDLSKKFEAGQDVSIDILIGIEHINKAIKSATTDDVQKLKQFRKLLKDEKDMKKIVDFVFGEEFTTVISAYSERSNSTIYGKELMVTVDRQKALFSSWYELFPRSCTIENENHGSFKSCIRFFPQISKMGFDVLYLPPIHPIGKTHRKGKNNSLIAQEKDPGSPWAIGSEEGGHKSINPLLGTWEDFQDFIKKAQDFGMEVALDLAFQCSPDHPYVKEHPEWFKKRPDGTIQYAENPPKKYEDIIPFNFESDNWHELWEELKSIVLFWIEKGIRIFRVDNPHTKPFRFWKWLISAVKKDYPEVIFLSEAFTRPKIMHYLAKIGFTQSYTYFTWRNTKQELIDYVTELTQGPGKEYLRPNFWPNTPDILPEFLQYGGRPAFLIRLILAATLSSNYGIYGPAFELCVSEAIPGKEEYLNAEKYEIKHWDWNSEYSIKEIIEKVNKIRTENPALHTTWNIKFYEIDNEYLLFYRKKTEDLSNIILVAVNLDPFHTQSGWVKIPLAELKLNPEQPYLVHDLLSDDKYIWKGERNYIKLDPFVMPAHIFCLRRHLLREHDFDYYM